jgi:predicted metal-dependent phosphoesterase TrpH
MIPFDLQSHSTVSDGELGPAEVVAAAATAGVELLSLTDHDAVDGVDAALAAGAVHGVRIVPGVELSVLDGGRQDLHLCGYLMDHHHPGLTTTLSACRDERLSRADRMADALEACGIQVDRAPLHERSASGATVGRPHLAQAAWSHPANAERFAAEGHTGPTDVLVAYLIPGAPAFLPRAAPSMEEGIALIHEAGGVAVWAHPFWDLDSDEAVTGSIDRFTEMGLDGVEAFYVAHSEAQTRVAVEHCARRGLLTTGSADFHGPHHANFSRFGAFHTYGMTPNLGPIGEVGRG